MNDEIKGKLFVVYGPSGAGKTTLVKEALKRLSADYDISAVITYTSRRPRAGEINGKDYFFISYDEFLEKRREDFFIETNEYLNNQYGSPNSILDDLENGRNLIIITDRNGAKNLSQSLRGNVILIWVEAPIKDLKGRIKKRNGENDEQVEKRLVQAKKEIEDEHTHRMYDYCIENDNFDQSLAELILAIKDELRENAYFED